MEILGDRWILIEEVVQNKTIVTAIDYTDIRTVVMDSKLVGGKLRRTFEFLFKDDSVFVVPDEAVIVSDPPAFGFLVNAMAKRVKV